MAKNKPNKTYSVFVTIDGTLGMAAGVGLCDNRSVKEADRIALRQNGYRQVGSVFTKSGKLSIEELKDMIGRGEACTLGRVHVSTFISRKADYSAKAAESIEAMKVSLRRKAEKEAEEKAEIERRKTAEKLIEVYEYEYENPYSEEDIVGTFKTLDEAWEYVKEEYSRSERTGPFSESSEFFDRNDNKETGPMVQMFFAGYYTYRVRYRTIWV